MNGKKRVLHGAIFALLLVLLAGAFCLTPVLAERSGFEPAATVFSAHGDPTLLERGEVTNVVIFICFSDETPLDSFPAVAMRSIEDRLNGDGFSLNDYYRTLSYGAFSVRSVLPTKETGSTLYYVFKAQNKRSYYENIKDESGSKRYAAESGLVNAAIKAAESHFDFSDVTLDSNNDGFVDSVSVIVSGSYPSNWGGLMWPHAWNLTTISQNAGVTPATLNGLTVDCYTFTFSNMFSVGLLAHEFGHLVGMPDYYHYDYNTDRLSVGYWDLMHYNCSSPQFTLTYTRDKYLSFIDKKQVKELTVSGSYSLSPTATAEKDDLLAYKITLTDTESVWLEYRFNSELSYDREMPASGLVVYHVDTSASGNEKSRWHSATSPDEVYVYRPDLATEGTIKEKEIYNLNRAALSLSGETTLGTKNVTTSYSDKNIYLSNGRNTGIVVTVTEESPSSVTFSVDLGAYDCSRIDDSYVTGLTLDGKAVKNEHFAYFGEEPKVSVFLKYNNRPTAVELYDFTIEYDKTIIGDQTAYVVFSDEYDVRKLPFTLHTRDVPATLTATVLRYPDKTTLNIGEELDLQGLVIQIPYLSSRVETVVYSEQNKTDFILTEGLDNKTHGTYDHVRVRYGLDVYFTLSGIVVLDDLLSLRVDETNSKHLSGDHFELSFTVVASYRNGSEEVLSPNLYTLSFSPETPFDRSPIVIRSKDDPDIMTTTYGYDVGAETIESIETLSSLGTLVTNYGEEPVLSGNKLVFTFSNGKKLDGENALPLENYTSELLEKYIPTKMGNQDLTLSLGTGKLPVRVLVTPKATSLLTLSDKFDGIINEDKNYILVSEETDLSALSSALTSSLTITFLDVENGYELSPSAFSSRKIGHASAELLLKTKSGVTVSEYALYLLGDADGDGYLTDNDRQGWLAALLNEQEYNAPSCLDANGDGKYSVTDLALLTKRFGKGGTE